MSRSRAAGGISTHVFAALLFLMLVAFSTTVFAQSCELKSKGDADCDGKITILDYNIWRREYLGLETTTKGNFDGVGTKPGLEDFEIWRRTYTGDGGTQVEATNTPTPTNTPPPGGGGGGNTTGRFYIVGSTIVGPDGKKFIPAGANMSGICFWSSPDETVAKAQAAKDWGWTAIRLNNYSTALGGDCWGKTRGWNDIDAIVNAYTSRKIVVILDAHDTVGDPLLPTESSVTNYFREAANKYKNNPYVWFQLSNEPYASASAQDETDWMNFHKRILAVIRAQGSENIVIGGAISYGNDPTNVNARLGPQIAAGQCNVAFDVHPYFSFSDTAKANAYVKAVQDAGVALIYGEFGVPHPPGTRHVPAISYESTLASNENAIRLANQYGIGIFKWHGTTPSSSADFSLFVVNGPDKSFDKINSYTNPTNLTLSGKMLWDFVHNLPNQGAFTGNLAESNCPSAQ